jgi:TolB protein
VQQADCNAGIGEFCLNAVCRGAEDTRVESLFRVAVAPLFDASTDAMSSGAALEAEEVLRGLLASTVFFEVLPEKSVAAETWLEAGPNPARELALWGQRRVFAIVSGKIDREANSGNLVVALQWVEVESGRHVPLPHDRQVVALGGLRQALQAWCDDAIRHYTGRPGILGTRIAYSRRPRSPNSAKEIFTTSLDGRGVIQLTNNGSINVLPNWAPGERVGYTSYQSGVPSLYVGERLFAHHGDLQMGITWRKDGLVAAASVSLDRESPDIFLLDGQTGELIQRLTHHPSIDTSPTFSHDGQHIAFVSDRGGAPQIWMMRADGSDLRCLTPGCGYCTSPDWSPVGPLVAYNAMVGPSSFDLFTIRVDSGAVRRLTSGGGSNEEPTFSPDGRYVAFTSTRSSRRGAEKKHLFVMPAQGGPASQVSSGEELHFTPAWSREFVPFSAAEP